MLLAGFIGQSNVISPCIYMPKFDDNSKIDVDIGNAEDQWILYKAIFIAVFPIVKALLCFNLGFIGRLISLAIFNIIPIVRAWNTGQFSIGFVIGIVLSELAKSPLLGIIAILCLLGVSKIFDIKISKSYMTFCIIYTIINIALYIILYKIIFFTTTMSVIICLAQGITNLIAFFASTYAFEYVFMNYKWAFFDVLS